MMFPRNEHSYKDGELLTGAALAGILGVSKMAVTKAVKSGRLDTFENSKGKPCFARDYSVEQYLATKNRSKITTPTRAQREAGFTNSMAQSAARVVGSENPNPTPNGMMQRVTQRITENVGQLNDWRSMFQDLDIDLETSRAVKETQMARLASLKADEKDGLLVDKHLVFQKNYQATNEVQEKLTSLYAKIAPVIVGDFVDASVNAGLPADVLGDLKKSMEHSAGERIRVSIIDTLRELTDKMMSEEKFYG